MFTKDQLGLFRQYQAATIASISVIILGSALGWPSPVLSRITEHNDPFSMTDDEISWMVSVLYLGNIVSPLPAGYLMDKIGRKLSFMVLAIIPLSSWVLIRFATGPVILYIARFLSGTWSGIVSTVAPMYLAEISEPRIRGALSTFVQMMTNMGVLAEYIIGPRVSYNMLAYISGALPVIFIILMAAMPESPYWLVMKGKKDKARDALIWLRGGGDVKEEMELMSTSVEEEMKSKGTLKDLVATPGNRRALLIVQMLALLQRMSGVSALMAYTSTTLPSRGAGSLTPNDCVIVMGCVWVISVFGATIFVDSLGRKPLLIASSLGCGVAMFSAGAWFYLDGTNYVDVSDFYYTPFASFLVYGLFFCIGLGPIASTVQGEAFPTNIKGLASGITSFVLAITSFVMNKIYHTIADQAGMYLNYWIFSGACFASLIFCLVYMIETKGKSLSEIQDELNYRTRNKKAKKPAEPERVEDVASA
ncbi:facilitated trehalose transporter Tret1-like [Nesidiocoris tenuis]|uniref:Facilitated trehalose transporter Tret1-like n=1 Tax=Nesidiocoris tenuis TaxID=355587 RepID=A0ABN7ADL9_9HEMI|nr:facilitated trehalose transporter Tret1-like [Nesidiocoris tenuis]